MELVLNILPFPQGPRILDWDPQITSTQIKCYVMLLKQIFSAF